MRCVIEHWTNVVQSTNRVCSVEWGSVQCGQKCPLQDLASGLFALPMSIILWILFASINSLLSSTFGTVRMPQRSLGVNDNSYSISRVFRYPSYLFICLSCFPWFSIPGAGLPEMMHIAECRIVLAVPRLVLGRMRFYVLLIGLNNQEYGINEVLAFIF